MVASNKLLLDSVSGAVRKTLVRERIRAMRGEIEDALHTLDHSCQLLGGDRPRDLVAIGMLRAELLHFNRQDREALQCYRRLVLPLKEQLDTEEQFVLEQNLADLEFSVWSPEAGNTFYSLVDRRRLAGFEWFDAQDILEAQEAAAQKKHYEALPIIWRHAVRAYLQGCWLSARWAAKRLAVESLQLGSLVDAAFYAITAPTEELVEPVAQAMLRRRDVGIIRDVLRRLLGSANLRRHFSMACELLYQLGDAIPDEELPTLTAWLLPRCGEFPDGARGSSALNLAWKALEPIAHRLQPELARRAVETAFSDSVWTTPLANPNALFIEREQMVKTVNRLAAAVNVSELSWIAQEALPLVGDRRQIHDYGHVVNLLCHIAERGGSAVKHQIGAVLFPPGKPVDRMLIQAARLLSNERPSPEKIAALANQIANEIRLQVQFVGSGEEPIQVPETVMQHNQPMGDRTRVISSVGGVGLHAVARHRDLLSTEALGRLIEAILAMANEPENSLANRTGLLQGLRQFADRVDDRTRRQICLAIERIAKGEIVEPSGHSAADATNPLNPFKFDNGQPEQLQTAALVTLAEFARGETTLTRLVWPVFEEAIYAPNPAVRRGAFAAAARLPVIPDALLLAVLTGCRDPEPDVATAAFFALAKQPAWELTRSHWQIFLHGLRLAAQSPHDKMRCNAAWAGSVSAGRAPTKRIKATLDAILALFRQDICASVREATRVTSNVASTLPANPPDLPGGIRDVPATQPGEVEKAALGELFSKSFLENPEGAVDYLRQQVYRGSSRQVTAEVLLPYAVKAPYAQQNLVCAALLELATPNDLIHAALAVYWRNEDPRLLQEAAGLLERYGPAAWPALARLAGSGRPECRYFVAVIAGLAGVAKEDKYQALAELARNPDIGVRREIVEILEGGCLSNPGPVWEVLAHDRDEQLASIASDHLAVLRD